MPNKSESTLKGRDARTGQFIPVEEAGEILPILWLNEFLNLAMEGNNSA